MNKFILFLKNNKAPILIFSGVAALFGATVASIPMTVKATHAVDKKKKDLNTDKLSMKEYFATIWKYYIPTAACTAVSFPLIIMGNKEYGKKLASFAAYATATATSLQKLEEKIPQIVGKENEQKIKEAVAQDKVNKTDIQNPSLLVAGDSDQLFYEPITNQYFRSTINKMDKIKNQLTNRLCGSTFGEVYFDEYLQEIGLEGTQATEYMEWVTEGSNSTHKVDYDYIPAIKNDRPVISLEYKGISLGANF